MPNNPRPVRPQLRPGPDFDQRLIPVTRQPQRIWFRVHKSGSRAVWFGTLPHHRFSHPNSPFSLLYLGATIQTCLWEYFGDDVFQGKRAISAGKWQGCCVSQIVVPELKVCAVGQERTRDAMSVDKASLFAARPIPADERDFPPAPTSQLWQGSIRRSVPDRTASALRPGTGRSRPIVRRRDADRRPACTRSCGRACC